jgi:hypothetical protein
MQTTPAAPPLLPVPPGTPPGIPPGLPVPCPPFPDPDRTGAERLAATAPGELASGEPLPLKLSLSCSEPEEEPCSGWRLLSGLGGSKRFVAIGPGAVGLVSEGLLLGEVTGSGVVGSLNRCLSDLGLKSVSRGWERGSGCGSAERLVTTGEGGEIGAGSGDDETTGWRSLVGWIGAIGASGAG